MKKILLALIAVLLPVTVSAQVTRQQAEDQLIGFGMPGQMANLVAGLSTGNGVVSNDTWQTARNAAGTANINVWKVDSTDSTQINASEDMILNVGSGDFIQLSANSTPILAVGDIAGVVKGAYFQSSGQTLGIQEATAGAACSGTLTANGATPVVTSTTCAITGARIFLSRTSAESAVANAWVSAISTGVSFSITGEAGDTGTYNWFIIHESP